MINHAPHMHNQNLHLQSLKILDAGLHDTNYCEYDTARPNFDHLKFQKLNIDSFTLLLAGLLPICHANNNYMYNRDTSSTDIVQHYSIVHTRFIRKKSYYSNSNWDTLNVEQIEYNYSTHHWFLRSHHITKPYPRPQIPRPRPAIPDQWTARLGPCRELAVGSCSEVRPHQDTPSSQTQGKSLRPPSLLTKLPVIQLQCNQAREQNFLKPNYWAKSYTDRPIWYQNGHNNHFYCVLRNCKFPIYS